MFLSAISQKHRRSMISIWTQLLSKLYRLAYESCTESNSNHVGAAPLTNQYNGIIKEFSNKLISVHDLRQYGVPHNIDELLSTLEKLLTFANNTIDSKVFGNTFTLDKKMTNEVEDNIKDDNEQKDDNNNSKLFAKCCGIKLYNYCRCDNIDESILFILKLKINYNNIINDNSNNNSNNKKNVCIKRTDKQDMNDEIISNTSKNNNDINYSYDDIQDDLFHFMYKIFGGFGEKSAIHCIIDYFGLKIENSDAIDIFLKINRLSFDLHDLHDLNHDNDNTDNTENKNENDSKNKFNYSYNIYDENMNKRLKDIMQNKYDKRLLLYEMFLRENVSLMLRNKMEARNGHDYTALDCSIKLNNNDINQLIVKYANAQIAGINQCCSSSC